MMSAIFGLDALISLIVVTTRCTTRPPLPATTYWISASIPRSRAVASVARMTADFRFATAR
jgi:hypothetical protein